MARRRSQDRPEAPSPKSLYYFKQGAAEGGRDDRNLLGGKGANLAEMCQLGLPVPPGFTLSTDVCNHFVTSAGQYPDGLHEEVDAALRRLEKDMGKGFGVSENPLLVSVRSGARVSMPGMMDTVLNLGLNDATVLGLAGRSGNPRFAWDAYRRFVQMYGEVVLDVKSAPGVEGDPFQRALDALKRRRGVEEDTALEAEDLEELVRAFKQLVKKATGRAFPEDPMEQLWGAIGAVFGSWDNERAIAYRRMNQIPSSWGTAVNVVAMVFGNMGATSGTGVAFTRDPTTGEKRIYGEYHKNSQGEDVVAGLRTPRPIESLHDTLPAAYGELQRIQKTLERHYRDMQDLEFTIEDGQLYMLQCRTGKRTGFAAVRIAVDLVKERRITREEALLRVEPESLNQLLRPIFPVAALAKAREDGRVLTRGLNAGPGAATGRFVLTAARAERWAARGDSVILTRGETSPEDIKGMQAACGILTARGGMTSHAALVARQMGKVCVAGAGELEIDYEKRTLSVNGSTFKEGEWLSLDGSTGDVIAGRLDTVPSEVHSALFEKGRAAEKLREAPLFKAFEKLMTWADQARTLGVRANADQPDQCATALAFGAQGIGLCRTEHMFFEEDKIRAVREMILAEDTTARERALRKLLPLQRRDFEGIFKVMGDRPVTVRTLDPPLHEFLPHTDKELRALAKEIGHTVAHVRHTVASLEEQNPMLGHRGCRLGITYPEITRTQARALFEAACNVARKTGVKPRPEIMIPLVGTAAELRLQAREIHAVAQQVFARKKMSIPYLVGTMIELPRAALTAADIAAEAEFFSFGTNDLTQTTFGLSRDDGAHFLPHYVAEEIYASDPFAHLDVEGTGRLMRIAVDDGRARKAGLKIGICGEHGGDPSSIEFCQTLGLDYVSCSPYRIPIARLAAAQAALRAKAAEADSGAA